MKRIQSILCVSLLTLALSPVAFGKGGDITGSYSASTGDITGKPGDITGSYSASTGDITGKPGDITGIFGDITGILVTLVW